MLSSDNDSRDQHMGTPENDCSVILQLVQYTLSYTRCRYSNLCDHEWFAFNDSRAMHVEICRRLFIIREGGR